MSTRFDRNALDALRMRKSSRHFYRLVSPTVAEYEFRGPQPGHPSNYAFVRFECAPADDISFEARVSWPPTISNGYQVELESAIAEAIADVLLNGLYQHTGCAISLVAVGWDDVSSSEASFMTASRAAMESLLADGWKIVLSCEAGFPHH